MGHPEKMVNVNGNGGANGQQGHFVNVSPIKAHHHAIKIIPEDVELSTGIQRSRSSSVQLHVPLLTNSFSSIHEAGEKSPIIDLDLLAARDAMEPPLPSPEAIQTA